MSENAVSGEKLGAQLAGRGFEMVSHLPGSTFRDCSTVIIVPTRGIEQHTMTPSCQSGDHRACYIPAFHAKVVTAWQSLINPMNQKRAFLYTTGHEVGRAYNELIAGILSHPELSKWQYVLTLEDDNLPPCDAHVRLLECIVWGGGFDAVSGIYWTKGDYQMPQAYGDPDEFRRTGVLDFRPRDVRAALDRGTIMPVNGIGMGCALWRMDLFRSLPAPWFVTVNDLIPDRGVQCFTQDLYFCERAVRAGKRFAVDMRVRVGHLDPASGIVY